MSALIKCSVALALLIVFGAQFEADGKPVDMYEDIVGNDEKLFLRMLELIESIGSDDSEDDSSRLSSNSEETKNGAGHKVTASEKCLLPMRKGVCRALIPRWSYDPISKECKEFKFGGCDGNGNNFSNEKLCRETCKGM